MILQRTSEVLRDDLDPEFIKSLSVGVGWEYSHLYEQLADDLGLSETLKVEAFGRRRSTAAVRAMVTAAKTHKVPYNFRRLDCNGQDKLLVKAGRIVLIQEPILTLGDQPHATDYKRELADAHGLVRQLELELGDQPHRICDWSGCILAVLLHAPAGPKFSRSDRALGALMLGVPDAAYQQWTLRLDLHQIAMFGGRIAAPGKADEPNQPDNVVITPKKKSAANGTRG